MIRGKKINLRLVTDQDVDVLFNLIMDVQNRGDYFPITLTSYSDFKKTFNETGFWSDSFGRFLITDQQDIIVGSIYYFKTVIYSDALELGYIIFSEANKGKGYTTEALKIMVDYLFKIKTMNRIQLRINSENIPSVKAAINAGFQFDGTRRQIIYLKGKHLDLDEYALLRGEWKS